MIPPKITSFGYKARSLSPRADTVIDVREFSHDLSKPEVNALIEKLAKDYKPGQCIAIGCERGKHRSVEIAKRLGKRLGLKVRHRDK